MTAGAYPSMRGDPGLGVPITGVACPTGGDPDEPTRDRRIGRLRVALETACPPLSKRLPAVRATVEAGYRAWANTDLGLAAELREPLEAAVLEGIVTAAGYEADALEARLEAHVDADVEVSVAVDCDGFATQYARRTLDRLLRAAETAAVEAAETAAVEAAETEVDDDLVSTHARVVSVAALLLAARTGVQAAADSCGVVCGKRWVVPEVAPCPLHEEADGRTAPIEGCFAVPEARGVATSAFLVGEHRPFACSCLQEPVLGVFPPEEPRALAALDGVSVRRPDGEEVEPLSEREWEVYCEHAHPGETFAGLLDRFHETRSVRGGARELGVAKKTLYRWFDKYIEGFDRYSGR